MPTISLKVLSDKTLAKYEELERQGKLTNRQKRALWEHRNLTTFVNLAAENAHRRAERQSHE